MTPTRIKWLAAALMLSACRDEGLVGDSASSPDTQEPAAEDECDEERNLDAIPSEFYWFEQNPAALAEQARGEFYNSSGDTLTVDFSSSAKSTEYVCYGDPTIPVPTGPRPFVTLTLFATATLRTADGAWNETFEIPIEMNEVGIDGGEVLSTFAGQAKLPLYDLNGSFMLPANLEGTPEENVNVALSFKSGGWLLDRSVNAARKADKCSCGDFFSELWSVRNVAFIRR